MSYDDKTMLTDMLSTQKFIASNYNSFAGECSNKQSKSKLMKILSEEHDIQFKIFETMHAKGWYPTPKAPEDKVNQAVVTHIKSATNVKASQKQTAKTTKKPPSKAKATKSLK